MTDKKGAILLRTLLIGFVVAAMLGIGAVEWGSGLLSEYGMTIDGNVSETVSAFNESAMNSMYYWSKGIQNETQNEEGISETTGEAVFTSSSFQIVKKSFDLLDQVWNMVNQAAKTLGISAWALVGASTILLIIITLVVISTIFRKDT
jgi:hypothetical protein